MTTYSYIELELDECRLLADFIGIQYDLESTIRFCEYLKNIFEENEFESDIIEALTIAILI